jgi:predicted outer membrane protein
MFRKRLAVALVPLFTTTMMGAAFADPKASAPPDTAKLSETLSVLHAVGQWSINLSGMAEKNAKSDLVKGYARDVTEANMKSDEKLMGIAKDKAIEIRPIDPQTEQGKSVVDRMNAETAMLGSLQGDAFDKEYMTLVTNTQQSVIHVLGKGKAEAKDPKAKQFLGDVSTTVQNRLKTAQDIMVKVYGDKI